MRVFIITGQTATGKTDYAVGLAHKYNGELISCDSRQIYKELDIITGKDLNQFSVFSSQFSVNKYDIGYHKLSTENRQPTTIIWLYDIIDPKEYFSSYDWVQCALKVIKDILLRGNTPIIVGGTYFYLYHLLYDVETQHIKPNWKLREKLNVKPIQQLQKLFQSLDKEAFNQLNNSDKNNPQRLIRKIEILSANKQAEISSFRIPSSFSLSKKLHTNVQIEYIGLRYKNIHALEHKIKERVEKRIESGAFEEVKKLLKQGYSQTDPGLKTIGYSQIIKCIKGKISKKDAVQDWITKEIQYAKRQYTFMKKDSHIVWKETT